MTDLGEIVRTLGAEYVGTRPTTPFQRKALTAIARCRTSAMPATRAVCSKCGAEHLQFRSCRNRNCPRCQSQARVKWLRARESELLDVPYFHVVFTVPEVLNPLALWCPEAFYHALFRAVAQALLDVGCSKLRARLGALLVLHTWGQNLMLHPHIHCVVPGGGLSLDGSQWIGVRKRSFLLPEKVLSKRFRNLLCDEIRRAWRRGKLARAGIKDAGALEDLLGRACRTDWVVHAKPPFGGPQHVLAYLSSYTHRIAISNRRLVAFDGKRVTFRWRDYADNSRPKLLTLDGHESSGAFCFTFCRIASSESATSASSAIAIGPTTSRSCASASVRPRRNLHASPIRCRSSVPHAPRHEPRPRCRREPRRQSWRPRHEPDLPH